MLTFKQFRNVYDHALTEANKRKAKVAEPVGVVGSIGSIGSISPIDTPADPTTSRYRSPPSGFDDKQTGRAWKP